MDIGHRASAYGAWPISGRPSGGARQRQAPGGAVAGGEADAGDCGDRLGAGVRGDGDGDGVVPPAALVGEAAGAADPAR